MGGWGWGTGLAGWGTGCLVRIAGFHSWAVAADRGEEKGCQCCGAKPLTRRPGAPRPAPSSLPFSTNCLLHPEGGGGTEAVRAPCCPFIWGHDVLSIWLEGHLPVSSLPQVTRFQRLIHPVRRGLDSKAPFMCLPAPGLWQENTDNGMCFRKGDPLKPCIRKLNMGGPGSIPHTEQHTRMFSSGPCVQRSREAGLWGVQTTLSRQATERKGEAARGRGRTPVLEDLQGDS